MTGTTRFRREGIPGFSTEQSLGGVAGGVDRGHPSSKVRRSLSCHACHVMPLSRPATNVRVRGWTPHIVDIHTIGRHRNIHASPTALNSLPYQRPVERQPKDCRILATHHPPSGSPITNHHLPRFSHPSQHISG